MHDQPCKQIGLALLNYHEAFRLFPPGYVSKHDAAGDDTGPGWGWAAFILPQMEQQNLFTTIRFDQNIADPVNSAARVQPIKTYICPSDSVPATWTATQYTLTGAPIAPICDVASASYIGNFGITEPGVNGEGIFCRGSPIAITDIKDGASLTMMAGERSFRWCQATWVGSVTNAGMVPPPGSPALGGEWNASGFVLGHTFEGSGGPGSPGTEVNGFASQHPGRQQLPVCRRACAISPDFHESPGLQGVVHSRRWRSDPRRFLMRRALMIVVLLLSAGGALPLLAGCGDRGKVVVVTLDQVPEAFVKTAQETLPEVTFDHARKLPNGNYEIRSKMTNGKVREVEVNSVGEVVEIE